jgi:hypothetical protein
MPFENVAARSIWSQAAAKFSPMGPPTPESGISPGGSLDMLAGKMP